MFRGWTLVDNSCYLSDYEKFDVLKLGENALNSSALLIQMLPGELMSTSSESMVNGLIAEAKAASRNAYCPYSKFRVGAALITDKGNIFSGCNVENASYGLTVCAERNAIFQMVSRGDQKIEAIVIYTPTDEPASPCGACRQVLNEFGPTARVISVCDSSARNDTALDKLLPGAFGPTNLV